MFFGPNNFLFAIYILNFFSQVFCSLPGSLIMWLSYLVPSFIMSGLHYQGSNAESTKTFYLYVAMSLIYLHGMQLLATAISWLTKNTFLALFFIFVLFSAAFTFSGKKIFVNQTKKINFNTKFRFCFFRLPRSRGRFRTGRELFKNVITYLVAYQHSFPKRNETRCF